MLTSAKNKQIFDFFFGFLKVVIKGYNRAKFQLSIISQSKVNLGKEAGRALAMALATNSVLKELDVSNNLDGRSAGYTQTDGAAFAQELAVGIRDNGALIKLDISMNNIGAEQKGDLQRICVASGIELVI